MGDTSNNQTSQGTDRMSLVANDSGNNSPAARWQDGILLSNIDDLSADHSSESQIDSHMTNLQEPGDFITRAL